MEAYDLIPPDSAIGADLTTGSATAVATLADDPAWLTLSIRCDLVDRCRAAIADDRYESDDRYDLAIARLASRLN